MQVETIEDVLEALSREVEAARASASPMGYFPALYRKVTAEIGRSISAGAFDDAERMADFDVRFAGRYLEAAEAFRRGGPVTRSWQVCLRAAADPAPTVLQHLLLGFNAHINLDLGIAAARTAPGDALPALRRDFETINTILSSLVDEVERSLAAVWPPLRPLDWLAGRIEERLAGFSMVVARDHAWRFAQALAAEDEPGQAAMIDRVDVWIGAFGARLRGPIWPLRSIQRAIRAGERGSVPEIIDRLA